MTQKQLTAKTTDSKSSSTSKSAVEVGSQPKSALSPQDHLHQLHSHYGNRAVQRMYASRILQARLKVGRSNDKYEREADNIADRVMSMTIPQIRRKPT